MIVLLNKWYIIVSTDLKILYGINNATLSFSITYVVLRFGTVHVALLPIAGILSVGTKALPRVRRRGRGVVCKETRRQSDW